MLAANSTLLKYALLNKKGARLLVHIGKLYSIEREIENAPFEEKRLIRLEKSKPIIDTIYSIAW